tara:strand:- start:84152 stop:84301 length:150 start_codon:yes stop_codon:yes gene_type:complete
MSSEIYFSAGILKSLLKPLLIENNISLALVIKYGIPVSTNVNLIPIKRK